MSRVTYLKEIIINDDVSIYTILYELYQDMYHKKEWAGENGSHPFTGDVTSIFEPHAKEGKSLENREIVIAAAGGNMTYDESYNLLDGMEDIEAASTDIYNAIKEAYPSATRVGEVDANGDPTTTMSGPLTLHTDHFSRPYNVDHYFNGWTIVAKNAGQTGTGIIVDFDSSDGKIDVTWDVVVTTDTNTKYTMLPPSHVWWTCPPADIIVDRYNLFKREMAIEVLKQQRDAILSETEKYINPDYPHKYKSKKDSWKTYRQSIRNLTEQVETLSKPAWSNHSRDWGDDIPFDVDMKTFDPTKGTLRLKSKQESRDETAENKLENDSNFWTSNDTFGGWKKIVNGVEENITSGFNLTKPDETTPPSEDDININIFIVTVDDKTTNHPIQGDSSYAFLIDDVEGDFLKLTPGTYQFDQSHYSNKGYKIKLFIGGGDTLTEFTDNVSYNGNAGDTGSYLQVVITEMTPFSLQYHHEMHTSLNNVKNMGGYIHVGGTRMPPPLLGLNIDGGSTGNTNLTIKSSNGDDGEAHLTMISDNHEHEGDGFQLKVVNGILTLSSDHTKKETYDKTILTITGHATDTSILTKITGDLTVSGAITAAGYKLNKDDESGDVTIDFQQGGTTKYTMGIDDSDSNLFKIHSHTLLGDNSDFKMDGSGNVTIGGGLTINNGLSTGQTAASHDLNATTFDLDATGSISIDSGAASNFSLASTADGDDLTIAVTGATKSSLVLSSTGTGADAIKITASAGGIDMDAGTGGIDIDSTGTINIAPSLADGQTLKLGQTGATEMVFTPHATAANEKISLTNTAGTASDAIAITATAGGIDIDAGTGGIDIDSTGTINIAPSLADGQTLKLGQTGATEMVFTPHATASNEKISLTNTAGTASDAIAITATAGGIDIKATSTLDISTTANNANINISPNGTGVVHLCGGSSNSGVTITDGNELQFRDSDLKICSNSDGQLDLVADGKIQFTSPTSIFTSSTGNTDVTIKSGNATDGEAHLTMISDNHEDIGDGFQFKVVNGVFTLSSDHTTKETYDQTIFTANSNGDVIFKGNTAYRDMIWNKADNLLEFRDPNTNNDGYDVAFGPTYKTLKIYQDGTDGYVQTYLRNLIIDAGFGGHLYLKTNNDLHFQATTGLYMFKKGTTEALDIDVTTSSLVLFQNKINGSDIEFKTKTGDGTNTSMIKINDGSSIDFCGGSSSTGITIDASNGNITVAGKLKVNNGLSVELGSDAEGDIFYRDGSGDLANLAKGTAGQVLKMNPAETAPIWDDESGGGGGGVISSVDNFDDNRIVTAVGSNGLYGESALKFNSYSSGNHLDSRSDSDDKGLHFLINGFTRVEIDKSKIKMSAITEIDSAACWPSTANSAALGAATLGDPEYPPLRLIRAPSQTDTQAPDETMVALAIRSRLNTPNSVNSSTWPYAKKDYGVGLDFEVETGRFAQYTPDIKIGARIETVLISDAASGNHSNPPEVGEGFDLVFNTMSGGAPATEALRIHDNGNLTLKGDIILDGGGLFQNQIDGSDIEFKAKNGGGDNVSMIKINNGSSIDFCEGYEGSPSGSGMTLEASSGNLSISGKLIVKDGFSLKLGATNATGDMFYRDSLGNFARLARGTGGQVLKMNEAGDAPIWENESGGGGGGSLPSGLTYNDNGANSIFSVIGNITASKDITAFQSSDIRLKEKLVTISEPNEKIKKINGYEFDWNEKHEIYKNTHDVGVVAQEIEEVLPEIVIERDDGYKAVKYEKIIALLIESNKDLLRRVEELEGMIKK